RYRGICTLHTCSLPFLLSVAPRPHPRMEATPKVSAADGSSGGTQEPPHPTDAEEEERVQQLTAGELTSAASFGAGDCDGYDA
ncbi:unnamed protein product, partial [Ectocarpus sp. 12 AP-2014]